MSEAKNRIAVIVPAYNEGKVIRKVLSSLPESVAISGKNYPISIIVVNDGSKDNTARVVSKFPKVRLVNHILNSGAGAATRTGLHVTLISGANYAITMDADGQHAVSDVKKVATEIVTGDADLIIGSRLIETAGMPWYRVLGNKGLSFITFLVFGVFVRDSQSGLRAYNRKALEEINFHSNHFAFCSEIIWSAHRKGLTIKEIPITAIYSEYSLAKGQSNWGAVTIIRQIIKRRLLSIFHG